MGKKSLVNIKPNTSMNEKPETFQKFHEEITPLHIVCGDFNIDFNIEKSRNRNNQVGSK